MISIAIIGASGYSGAELARILASHRHVSLARAIAATSAGNMLDDLYPLFTGQCSVALESFDAASLEGLDLAYVALPSGEAMNIIPQLLPKVKRVIDLGGDFRLHSPDMYAQWYGREHTAPQVLGNAVYGLPELNKNAIAGASIIANPGCYPTGAILALLPPLQEKIIHAEGIVINSLSGVSGAGRSASLDLSFSEINENVRAYKIGRHQHIPEIEMIATQAARQPVSVSFVPHLVPITRGIYTTIHANLCSDSSEETIRDVFKQYYQEAPFVRVRSRIPQIKDVLYTNFCDIGITVEPRTRQLIIVSVIDNLVKGAAGQAVQNMNLMFGFPETEGLFVRKDQYHVH